MSLRPARAGDAPAIEAFLRDHVETSMFLLANLGRFGVTGGDHSRAMTFWCAEDADALTGVVAISTTGTVMPQMPGRADWSALAPLLAGRRVEGVIGAADQARAVLAALGLGDRPRALDADETLYSLALCDLHLPSCDGYVLRPLAPADRPLAVAWRADYTRVALGTDETRAREVAARDIDASLKAGSHRILVLDGTPVATTGFNATLPGIVQVGGVYTPPALRGRGHARRAVALHLAEARAAGATRAILFSNNPAACRAYESLGFAPIGRLAMIFLAAPATVACP